MPKAEKVPPIRTTHWWAFHPPGERPQPPSEDPSAWTKVENVVTISGRTRVGALAFAGSRQTFSVVALSADTEEITERSTGIGNELAVKIVPQITIFGTFIEIVVTFDENDLKDLDSGNPIRRFGCRTIDGQYLYIISTADTVPPANNSLTYVGQIEF